MEGKFSIYRILIAYGRKSFGSYSELKILIYEKESYS